MAGVVKVIELVGSSDDSWQEAAEAAVKEAHKTLNDLVGVEVVKWTANVASDGSIRDYKANVKIAFKIKGSE